MNTNETTSLELLEATLEKLVKAEIKFLKEANTTANVAGYTGPLMFLSKKDFAKRMKQLGYEVSSSKPDNSVTPFKAVYSSDPDKQKTKNILNKSTELRNKRGFVQMGLSYDMKAKKKKKQGK